MTRLLRPSQTLYSDSSGLRGEESYSASSFRARLCSPNGPVSAPPLPAPSMPKLSKHDDLYQQFSASLDVVDSSPTMAAPIPQEPKHDATMQLRESLAEAGLALHTSAFDKLMQGHEEVETKIADFARQSTPLLSRVDSLYSSLESPLSATICHSDSIPGDTIARHLARLRRDLEDADKELRRLGIEYDSCVQFEEAALRKLRGDWGDVEGNVAEMTRAEQRKTKEFKTEAEEMSRDTAQLLEEVEAEYKDKMQAETMKIMQAMLED